MIDFKCPYCNYPVNAIQESIDECWHHDGDEFEFECINCEESYKVIPHIKVEYEVKK